MERNIKHWRALAKANKIFKKVIIFIVIFATVFWSSGLTIFAPLIKPAYAAGLIDAQYTDDGGASNPPQVFLNSTSTAESIIKITASDTTAGANTLNSVTLQLQAGMNCPMGGGACTPSPFTTADLASLTTASTSGVSLWQDNGDDTFNYASDTLLSSTTAKQASAWTTQTVTDPYGGTFNVSQTSFSNLGLVIPTSFASPLTLFVAVAAATNIDASPLHIFMPKIPRNGIDVTSATLTDWPSDTMGRMFEMVALGTEGSGTNMQQSAPIVISEIQTASTTANVEFIELYNRSDQSYDLFPANGVANADAAIGGPGGGSLNLHIVNCTGTCTGTTTNPTLSTPADNADDIPANGYFLIASTNWNTAWAATFGAPDSTYDATSVGLEANGGAYISTSATADTGVIDKVGWGNQTQTIESMATNNPPSNGSLERKAYYSSTPTSMTTGIDMSKGNSVDTNNNSADFVTRPAGAAQTQNRGSATETDTIQATAKGVVINEILYNTTATGGWVELYNASSTAITLTNWTLNIATTTAQVYTFPTLSLAALSFVTLYWNQSGTNDTDTSDGQGSLYSGSRTAMSTYGGDVTLKNDSAVIVDYIQYGGPGKTGEAAAAAAGKWTAGNFQANSEYGQSIARIGTTGNDYDTSADWMYLSTPTPSLPNTGGDSTAPTAVTNVQLSDPDTSGFGLMGEDVRVSWTPSSTVDPGFDRYEIYLLPDGTALNTASHSIYSKAYGQYMWSGGTVATSSYSFTGGGFSMSIDSAGSALATGSYRAYVVAVDMAGNKSSSGSSAAAALTSENAGAAGADTNPPMIDHSPVWRAPINGALTFYARMGDDRTLSTAQLAYKVDAAAWGNATSTCAAPAMAGNSGLYRCIINWNGAWDANTAISYYLRAIDDSGNATYLGMYPTTSESTAKTDPVAIDLVAAADWNDGGSDADLSGTVFDQSGTPIQDAFVFVDGAATTTATTTSSGTFSFNDNALPEGIQFIRVSKSGYMEETKEVSRGQSGISFNLRSGFMSNSSGGSSGSNGVRWTVPSDNMMMAPTNISCSGDCSAIGSGQMPIIISFFNQMNASTIDDMDASNAGSNIYVTSDGNTKIAGKVKYVYNSGSNTSEARFYSDTALGTNDFYMVVVTPNVKDTAGNPISSNRPNGNYEFGFSTMADNTGMWGGGGMDFSGFGGGGKFMPPYVVGTNPTPGAYNIPLNSSFIVEFSEAMDSTVTNYIKLYRITNQASWTTTEVTNKNVTASLDSSTKKIITISHDALDANATAGGWYQIEVMGAAKSQLGVWMGNPMGCSTAPETCLATQIQYTASFQVSASSDTTAPTVVGTFPSNNDGIANSLTVDVAIPAIEIGFSEAMSPSSINSQSVILKKGTVAVAGTTKFDSLSNTAKFTPTSALSANSIYTLTVATSTEDIASNNLAAVQIVSFKTGGADTASPEMMFANGDDYQVAITFTEPMNAAQQTDSTNWTSSVLNPANYYINTLGPDTGCATPGSWACAPALVAPYSTVGGNQVSGLSNITISYDNESKTVTLKGFAGTGASLFQVFVDNIKDKSSNTIADSGYRSGDATHRNANRSKMQSSSSTYGMLGPSTGPGMMMGGGGPGGAGMGSGGPTMDLGKMGVFRAGAFPMNGMAGQTSNYIIDLPVTKTLQDGMFVVLTFPNGFNVASVAKDSFSPVNSDMNERAGGTVTFDTTYGVGGVASTTTNTITVKLDIATGVGNALNTTAGPDGYIDSLHIDLKGIKNSSIAKDFGTSGYSVDIKTKTADGALLESVTTMPFFLSEGGSNTLTVVVNAGDADLDSGTMSVYLGLPMTGPMEDETTTFTNGIATSTFSSIPSGSFMLFTDPFITIGASNFLGKPMPEPVTVSGNTQKNITIEKEAAGAGKAAVTVYLQGNFSTGGAADDVDIFANSANAFRVKTLTDVGSTNPNATFYLTEGGWSVGVGPAMPKGPMSGPPSMPDWMMPQGVNMTVGIETATSRALDPDGDSSDAAIGNTEPVLLNVANTSNFQVGDVVTFTSGTVSTATTTITSLVVNTSVTVTPQANWSALPTNTDTIVSVRESSNGSNDAKVFFNISTQSLKQIQGFVVDENNNPIGLAEVFAYQPQGSLGGAYTTADTSGKFTLKVGANGVYTVGAFKSGMPNAQDKSVEVRSDTSNSATDGNSTADIYLNGALIVDASSNNAGTNPLRLKLKRPSYTITGQVLNASSTPVANAPVWAYQPSGWGHADGMTNSTGNYTLYVDAGTWRVEADAPGVGWLQYDSDVTVTTASRDSINLKPLSGTSFYNVTGTVTIDGSAQANMPIHASKFDATGNPMGRDYGGSTDSNGSYTLTVPTGYYRVNIWTPAYGEVGLDYDQVANSAANINVTAATTTANITVAAVDLQTISIQFTNGTSTQTGFLNISEMDFSSGSPKPTGFFLSTTINGLSATSTVKLKGSASGKYYFFDLSVPGYGFYVPDLASRQLLSNTNDNIKVTNAARAVYFTLPNASTGVITISGTVVDGSSNNLADAWVWAGNPNSNYHSGTHSASNGTFSLTVPKLASGNYMLGADKANYSSPSPSTVSATAASSNNTLTLTATAYNISGYVYTDTDSSGGYSTSTEALPNAWVWGEESATGQMSYVPADVNGFFELGVANGTWRISAGADGYQDGTYKIGNTKTNITVSGASVSSKNIALASDSGWSAKNKSKSVTPSAGGTIDDTATSSTGVKLTIPPNSMGQSSSAGNVAIQHTTAVTKTNSTQPLGGTGKSVTAVVDDTAVTKLDEGVYVDVELVYYKADIAAMNIVDYSKLKKLKQSYWDDSSNNWVDLSATRKAYYKTSASDTEWLLYPDSATQTGFEEFIDQLAAGAYYYDYKLVLTAKSNHLTVFGATMPRDSVYPASPTGLTQSSGSGASVVLAWSAVTTNLNSTAITDLWGYGIYRSTDNSSYTQLNGSNIATTTRTYTDSTTSAFTSYYYKVTAADDGGNETALASSTALQICSTTSIANGTISNACAITCDTGYTQSGNSCVSAGGAVISPGGGGASSPNYCSSVVYDEWQTDCAGGWQYRNVKSRIPDGCELTVSQENDRKKSCGANEAPTTPNAPATPAQATATPAAAPKPTIADTAQKIIAIVAEAAEVIKADINSLLGKFGFKRDLAREDAATKKYVKELIKDAKDITAEKQKALNNFIAYGTGTTVKLGAGERAGVVNSYKATFGKLPGTANEWSDTIKIANGRWPNERNVKSENASIEAFKKIYKRSPDRKNPRDDAAVTIIAYGLRPADRNTNSEKAAIKSFKAIYDYAPKSATAWDIVRAIAYSGAKR